MRSMISRAFALLAIAAITVLYMETASGVDVKPFRTKPTTVVFKFLEAVEVGTKDYMTYIDLDLFFESNKKVFKGCTSAEVKKYFDELVMLPVRHDPPLSSKFVERNEYRVSEEITAYETAKVSFSKLTAGKSVLKVRFDLAARGDQWVIVNMSGYFDKYILKACSKQ